MVFDPGIPFNELPLLPPDTDLDDTAILKKVNTADIALARLMGLPWLYLTGSFCLNP